MKLGCCCLVSLIIIARSSAAAAQDSPAPILRAPRDASGQQGSSDTRSTRGVPEMLPSPPPSSLPGPAPEQSSQLDQWALGGSTVNTPTAPVPMLSQPATLLDLVHQDFQSFDADTSTEMSRIFEQLDRMNAQFRLQLDYQRQLKGELERVRLEKQQQERLFEQKLSETTMRLREPVADEIDTELNISQIEPDTIPEEIPAPNSADDEPTTPPDASESSSSPDVSAIDGPDLVAAEAVDRPRLADSLYGAKRYDLALRLYRDLAQDDEQKPDRIWYYYQTAGCLRQMSQYEQAAKFYRIVAGAGVDEYLASQSKWWLQHMDKNTRFSETISDLRVAFESLNEEDPQ